MSAESTNDKSPLDGMTEAEVDEFYADPTRYWGACDCGSGGIPHSLLSLDCMESGIPDPDIGRLIGAVYPDIEPTGKEWLHNFMVCDACRTYWYFGTNLLGWDGTYEELREHSRRAAAKLASYTLTSGEPAWWDKDARRRAMDREEERLARLESTMEFRPIGVEATLAFLNEHDEEIQRGEIIVRATLRHDPGCPCAGDKKGELDKCVCHPTQELEEGRVPPSDDKAKDNK